MNQQQTVLRVQTKKINNDIVVTGTTSVSFSSIDGITATGTGTISDPFEGTFAGVSSIIFDVVGGGSLNFNIVLNDTGIGLNSLEAFIKHSTDTTSKLIFRNYSSRINDYIKLNDGDTITFKQTGNKIGGTFSVYYEGNIENTIYSPEKYENLDLYGDIPITINKSFAEIQDISKRNSDYSIGLKLPGTKRNNKFFENFFNVDQKSLYFDVTSKVKCNVLLNDESYFYGYLRLDRVSVLNSKIEYDVTLYSTIGDLFGSIGNNLLKDLNYRDPDYHFNHVFSQDNVLANWRYETLKSGRETPSNYFYPVMHSGYNYELGENSTNVQFTGTTGTSLYSTTKVGSWDNVTAAYADGVEKYRINSPEDGLRDNQLKPALNVYSIMQLLFKSYGYSIKSDFLTTPWVKLLYLYGYFSNDSAKLTFRTPETLILPLSDIDVILQSTDVDDSVYAPACNVNYPYNTTTWKIYIVKKGTGTPALCNQDITMNFNFTSESCTGYIMDYVESINIPANTTGSTFTFIREQWIDCGYTEECPYTPEYITFNGYDRSSSDVDISSEPLAYLPVGANVVTEITEGNIVDISLLMDDTIKQIDFLSSIAKKFNLLFIPDPENPQRIIVEPYDYYIGTGEIYDWTDKLSWDKGFSVEPAQNFVESEITISDLDDGDIGNKEFKTSNGRVYGFNSITNSTEFKSQQKKIETTFSPQVIRKWNPNNNPYIDSNAVGIPLGINYTEQSQEVSSGSSSVVDWVYKGVKTKPKLIFNLGNFSPFLDEPSETFNLTGVTTSYFRVSKSDGTEPSGGLISPVISHTMPMGNPDSNKINNDSISILFNSERPTTIAGDTVSLFDAYTNNDAYNLFYETRINNAFNKNTRMLTGQFNLKLSDIKNLKPNDLIKINEQYFTYNKIDGFKLTTNDLTKVELIQFNSGTKQYPERYFKYYYCQDPTTIYKFKTSFTGETSVKDTLYYYSILYDYFVGVLGGNVTGYTSSVPYVDLSYAPYTIYEVTESEYNASGTIYTDDPYKHYFLLSSEEAPVRGIYNQNNPIWLINSDQSLATLNVFTGCTHFNSVATTMGVSVVNAPPLEGFNSDVTIYIWDTGWLEYDSSLYPNGTEQYFGATGTYVLPGCVDCSSIRTTYKYPDQASWFVVDCGTQC